MATNRLRLSYDDASAATIAPISPERLQEAMVEVANAFGRVPETPEDEREIMSLMKARARELHNDPTADVIIMRMSFRRDSFGPLLDVDIMVQPNP